MYDHIIDRFGTDKTAYILALTTLADKAVIDVIGKAFRIKAEKTGKETPYTLDKIKSIKAEYDNDRERAMAEYPDLFYYYDGLVGCVVAQSQHPAGIVVSPLNLVDTYGGFYGADGQIILPIDMDGAHDVGAVKFDILGLKSVGVVDKTYKMIGKKFPRAYEVDWNDKSVFDDIDSSAISLFQFESNFASDCLTRFKPRSVEEIALVSACIRPSGETYRDHLLARVVHRNPSSMIDDILSVSAGYLVYQESTLAFLQQICGFSGSDADTIRRAIGKKKLDVIEGAMPQILDGYCSKSNKPRIEAEREAKEFLDVIMSSASYQFGFNHACSYAMLTYTMGYLRHYYPTEYCTAFMNCAKNEDDILNGTKLAQERGCKIVQPKFRYLSSEYTCDPERRVIYKGLGSIKNISNRTADALYQFKDKQYGSFVDLLVDLQTIKKDCDSKQTDILIKIDFFSEFGNINQLLKEREIFELLYERKTFKVSAFTDDYPIPLRIVKQFAAKQTDKTLSNFDWKELCSAVCSEVCAGIKTTKAEELRYELDILGYVSTTFPKLGDDYYFVTGYQGRTEQFMQLYQLRTGQTRTIRYRKKYREQNPTEPGDIIHIIDEAQEGRWRKDENNNWQQDWNNCEPVLKKWGVLK